MKYTFDAVILGGGAAGLLCAIAAKKNRPGLRVAIIEKNDRVGKKLIATGNGRCNLSHGSISEAHYTGSFQAQSKAVFERIDDQTLLMYFKGLGLLTSKDSEGRYYPLCRQASAVLDVLRFNIENSGVRVFCGETVKSIRRKTGFIITTGENTFVSEKLVIAAGSKAAPKLGGSASASDILKNFGHRFIPFSPALCPVTVRSGVLKALKGLRAQARVSLLRSGSTVKSECGEVQFNEDNLSGICVFNLSLYAKKGDEMHLDLLPDISEYELFSILLNNKARFAPQKADCLLTGILQKRVAQAALKAAGAGDFSKTCAELGENEIKAIAGAVKAMRFEVSGNADFSRAQACTGGVYGGEIDPRTMKSRVCDKLYICGEAVDICGECGGYNLHFAFASGIIAGESL